MGNFSRDTFKLTNTMYQALSGVKVKNPSHYSGVRLQQGVPLLDADWNELEDIRRYEQRATLKWLVGDGVPQGNDGFLIKNATVNDFTINQGVCYVSGWAAINLDDTKYTAQELYDNKELTDERKVELLPPINLASGQQYGVYLDVWEREINRWEDGRIVHDAIGIETCTRIKQEWVVRVAAGSQPPAAQAGHGYYKLAAIKVAAAGSVTVNDLRRTDLAMLKDKSVGSRHLSDNAVIADKIATGAVTADKIGANAVTTAKIADGQITDAKIKDDTITYKKLANAAVNNGAIQSYAVTSEKIAASAVTFDKMKVSVITWDVTVGAKSLSSSCSVGNLSESDILLPILWAVFPYDEISTYNYFDETPSNNTFYWYERTTKYIGRNDYIRILHMYNNHSTPIKVKVVCWRWR